VGEPLTATRAFDLQVLVVARVASQRANWTTIAEHLYAFHNGKGWMALGHDSFNEWLGQPEISLSRADAYAMIGAWRELVVNRDIDPELLGRLDVSKVAVVLPMLRHGDVDVEQALGDCESLSRSDLRAAYQDASHAEYRVCEVCGSRVKVA
jgi:hypothetical protein